MKINIPLMTACALAVLVTGTAMAGNILYVSPEGSETPPYDNPEKGFKTLQKAVDAAEAGDTVLVDKGTYSEGGALTGGLLVSRIAIDKPVKVQSIYGPEQTIIEGNGPNGKQAIRCAYVGSGAELKGFTLKGGHTREDGDLFLDQSGGGVWAEEDGKVTHCIIRECGAYNAGGGSHQGILENCIITENSAFAGGGAHRGKLIHCTLLYNTARNGGGTCFSDMLNTISYFNKSQNEYMNYRDGVIEYSCTTPLPAGNGNFTNDPLMVDPLEGNYYLEPVSPCIDAGTETEVGTDLARTHRPLDGNADGAIMFDVGAYEFARNDVDTDNDGLADGDEIAKFKTNPARADSDGDGLNDKKELEETKTNPTLSDTDNDGLSDGDEVLRHKTDPLKNDTDGDTLSDGDEVNTHKTSPLSSDTDEDGLPDSWEVFYGLNPILADADTDADSDRLSNKSEFDNGTDPSNSDSDNDGVGDYEELVTYKTSPTLPDTDEDGLSDGLELLTHKTNPLKKDSDSDTLLDGDEINVHKTNPNKADSDGDGQNDQYELASGADPNDPTLFAAPVKGSVKDTAGLTGPILIWASKTAMMNPDFTTEVTAEGIYEFEGLLTKSAYWLYAFIDVNSNQSWDALETIGAYAGNPVTITRNTDNIGLTLVYGDFDQDGFSDINELNVGTDPSNRFDPLQVDDDARGDPGPGDPAQSNPEENGSLEFPFDSIQEAIDVAGEGTTIIVHDGIYSGKGNRNITIENKALRLVSKNGYASTIIDTAAAGGGFILRETGDKEVSIEGFTIHTWSEFGGTDGIVCDNASALINRCRVFDSSPGLRCINGGIPLIMNSIFENNRGGIICDNTSPMLDACMVLSNRHNLGGGILLQENSSPTIQNTFIVGNRSMGSGGGIHIGENCRPSIVNSTIADNRAYGEGGAISSAGTAIIRNTIIWGNKGNPTRSVIHRFNGSLDIQHCNLQQFYPGRGNINADPLFAGAGSYAITAGSPCIDRGTKVGAPAKDFHSNNRPLDGTGNGIARMDIGAVEYNPKVRNR